MYYDPGTLNTKPEYAIREFEYALNSEDLQRTGLGCTKTEVRSKGRNEFGNSHVEQSNF